MSQYLQASTQNPYGNRPWKTSLYTGFENFAFIKQPQNTVVRGDQSMRPEIYAPPEAQMSGLGNATVVTGSGRVLRGGRRRGSLGAVEMMTARFPVYRPAPIISPIVSRGPITFTPPAPSSMQCPPGAECMPLRSPFPVYSPAQPAPISTPPITILPPPSVPPVPTPVATAPGGTVYALPGDATTPGSPFTPPSPTEIGLPGAPALPAPGAAPAAAAPATTSSIADWFNSSTWISGVPNGYVAIGIVGVIYMFGRKRR